MEELHGCWRDAVDGGRSVKVLLCAVTFMDERGKELLIAALSWLVIFNTFRSQFQVIFSTDDGLFAALIRFDNRLASTEIRVYVAERYSLPDWRYYRNGPCPVCVHQNAS